MKNAKKFTYHVHAFTQRIPYEVEHFDGIVTVSAEINDGDSYQTLKRTLVKERFSGVKPSTIIISSLSRLDSVSAEIVDSLIAQVLLAKYKIAAHKAHATMAKKKTVSRRGAGVADRGKHGTI